MSGEDLDQLLSPGRGDLMGEPDLSLFGADGLSWSVLSLFWVLQTAPEAWDLAELLTIAALEPVPGVC